MDDSERQPFKLRLPDEREVPAGPDRVKLQAINSDVAALVGDGSCLIWPSTSLVVAPPTARFRDATYVNPRLVESNSGHVGPFEQRPIQ